MSEKEFNPFVFKDILQEQEPEYSTIATGRLDTQVTPADTQRRAYEELLVQNHMLRRENDTLKDNFFALAEVMYQMLAFINAQRLYQGKDPIMGNDIANTVEGNLVLAEMTQQLREASIASELGVISQFSMAQNYLRSSVMQAWKIRFAGEERAALGEKLLNPATVPAASANTANDGDQLF